VSACRSCDAMTGHFVLPSQRRRARNFASAASARLRSLSERVDRFLQFPRLAPFGFERWSASWTASDGPFSSFSFFGQTLSTTSVIGSSGRGSVDLLPRQVLEHALRLLLSKAARQRLRQTKTPSAGYFEKATACAKCQSASDLRLPEQYPFVPPGMTASRRGRLDQKNRMTSSRSSSGNPRAGEC